MSEIIKDYGKTVDPSLYIRALQGHQYIPQADQCIRDRIHEYGASSELAHIGILDVGCGPGRLTFSFAHRNATVLGIDHSDSFIQYAHQQLLVRDQMLAGSVDFQKMDFTRDPLPKFEGPVESDGKWNVLVAQGVLHHIHGDERVLFFNHCSEALRKGGILVVGDEFIADYENEEMRRLRAAAFYFHIIAEAMCGGFRDLAREEAKNLIDDVLSGEKGCGYADEALLNHIERASHSFNYDNLMPVFSIKHPAPIKKRLVKCIQIIRERAEKLADIAGSMNFNRGDYKVSIDVFKDEVKAYGFKVQRICTMGPMRDIGGMGVLVFEKN